VNSFLFRRYRQQYFDKYQFEAKPELLREIAKQLAEMLSTIEFDLAGLGLGGVPIASLYRSKPGFQSFLSARKLRNTVLANLPRVLILEAKSF
jgi:orotate phosphoribosyltransferase